MKQLLYLFLIFFFCSCWGDTFDIPRDLYAISIDTLTKHPDGLIRKDDTLRGLKFVESGITSPAYEKMGYDLVPASDDIVKQLLKREIKTERSFMAAIQASGLKEPCQILYRRIVTKSDCKIIIETFFFPVK